MNDNRKKTYGTALKSSALVGGSSGVNIGLGMVRVKVMAILLGTGGVGLFGNFGAVSDLVRTIAGMGINMSGVRQIAEAVGTGDQKKIARTVTALRRVALWSGAVGALLLLALCKPISWLVFGSYEHAGSIALLSIAVFFADVSAGQCALVQGMRRIGDLAKMTIWGAIYGTLFAIPLIYFWKEKGVAPFLVCIAAMSALVSWWYARKIKVERVSLSVREVFREASGLLKLGVVFMASGFMVMGAALMVRAIVTRELGDDAAGLYQSAWVLGGVYMGYILQAMAADFYPRLTASANDNPESNRLVNEQSEIGLLIAGPSVLATLAFTPLFIKIFYTAQFEGAAELLRWIALGMLLRVVSWPMGFILVAKGERKLFFWSELVSNALYAGLIWLGVRQFGLTGAGMAFFGLYVCYTIGIYAIVRRVSGFSWSGANMKLAAFFAPLVALVFAGWQFLPFQGAMILGAVATMLAGAFSLRTLCTLVPLNRLPRPMQKALTILKLAPAGSGA